MIVYLKRFEYGIGHLNPDDAQRSVLDWINSNVAPDNVISITEIIDTDHNDYIVTVWWRD